MSISMLKEITKGFWVQNPVFVIALGLCPTLAVTTGVQNAIGMGVSTIFVLALSNVLISLVKDIVPGEIRIPCYIVIIAFLVTVVDLVLAAYFPEISKAIGLFIKLIVVNCIILGRAEAFAAKATPWSSFLDGIGMGIGFLIALLIVSGIREVLGANQFFGYTIFPIAFGDTHIFPPRVLGINRLFSCVEPIGAMVLAPGAFFTLGLLLGWKNMGKQQS